MEDGNSSNIGNGNDSPPGDHKKENKTSSSYADTGIYGWIHRPLQSSLLQRYMAKNVEKYFYDILAYSIANSDMYSEVSEEELGYIIYKDAVSMLHNREDLIGFIDFCLNDETIVQDSIIEKLLKNYQKNPNSLEAFRLLGKGLIYRELLDKPEDADTPSSIEEMKEKLDEIEERMTSVDTGYILRVKERLLNNKFTLEEKEKLSKKISMEYNIVEEDSSLDNLHNDINNGVIESNNTLYNNFLKDLRAKIKHKLDLDRIVGKTTLQTPQVNGGSEGTPKDDVRD